MATTNQEYYTNPISEENKNHAQKALANLENVVQ